MTDSKTPRPHSPPLVLSSVWECETTAQADAILGGRGEGYVYRRDGHPNADELAALCSRMHNVPHGVATSSGMSAIAAALLAYVRAGDQVVLSDRLYGKTSYLVGQELARLGIDHAIVDMCDLPAVDDAVSDRTKLVIVETIANPRLEVADIAGLAEIADSAGAKLLVDNTFATPAVFQPARCGAHLVMESLTKMMNGHSDVILGWLGGTGDDWARVRSVVSAWGLASSPMDCWLASRGLGTLDVRMERACATALKVAEFLSSRKEVDGVDYPGLKKHPQHKLAAQQFGERFGSLVTFQLRGGREAADKFIAASQIPFCPSLGEIATTLSHPESTSHRGLTPEARAQLGITGGTIRFSVGIEPAEEGDGCAEGWVEVMSL